MVPENNGFTAQNGHSGTNTPDRLLDAAEKLFCEHGFNGTNVRDLTKAADCNIAAVNYHFGGKNKLYFAMFQRYMERVFSQQKQNIADVMNSEEPTLEKLLTVLLETALKPLGQNNDRSTISKLMVREILSPHLKKDFVVLDILKDFLFQVRDALMQLLPELDEDRAMFCVYSLQALVIHPMIFNDFYYETNPDLDIDELISHIVEFAAGGLRKAAMNK